MKNTFRMFRRGTTYWCHHNQNGKQESLRTKDKFHALQLLAIKNQAHQSIGFHVQMAKTHLLVSDPQSVNRTWQTVLDTIISQKTGSTKERWERAAKSKSLDAIRHLVVAVWVQVNYETKILAKWLTHLFFGFGERGSGSGSGARIPQ